MNGCHYNDEDVCLANFDYSTTFDSTFPIDSSGDVRSADGPDRKLPKISVMTLNSGTDVASMTQLDTRFAAAGDFNLNGYNMAAKQRITSILWLYKMFCY